MGKCDWTMEEAQAWVQEHKEFEYQEENIGDLTEKLNGNAEAEIEIKEDKTDEIKTTEELDEKMIKSEPTEAVDYTGLEFAIKDLTAQVAELKEGRVLSTKNRTLVKNTIETLTELRGQLEELYEATEPPAREEERGLREREVIVEKDGKQDNLDERITGAIEKLFENDRLSKMMNGAIKEALDVSIKKKLGKVE